MAGQNSRISGFVAALLATSVLTACGGGGGGGSDSGSGGGIPPSDSPFYSPVLKFADDKRYSAIEALRAPVRDISDSVSGIERSASKFLSNIPMPHMVVRELPKVYKSDAARHMTMIGAQDAYARGITGKGVVVGVLETGFSGAGHYLKDKVVRFYDYQTNSDSPNPAQNPFHGDGVSMIIAGNQGNGYAGGVAPDAKLSIAHAYNSDTGVPSTFQYHRIYQDMLDAGIQIVNQSFGVNLHTIQNTGTMSSATSLMKHYQEMYVQKGILMVWAAGNYSEAGPHDYAAMSAISPALQNGGYLTVVATDQNGELMGYSNKCGVAANWCMAAPTEIYTPTSTAEDAKFSRFGGTSGAAPVVSGAAALVSQAFPYMKGYHLGQVLLGTASDIGAPGVDPVYGYGMLDVAKAIRGPGKFDWGDFAVSFAGGSVWQNDITGAGGLIKNGSGILRLTGNNTYTGGTTVNEGALVVNGSISSPLFIAKDGIVGGDGRLGSVRSEGILHAGWPYTGTLTVAGDYQNDGGSLSVVLGSKVDVTGRAIINGGLLAVDGVENTYVRSGSANVLTAGGGITGGFDRSDFRPTYLLDGQVHTGQNNITVTYDATALTAQGICSSANDCTTAKLIEDSVSDEAAKTGETTLIKASNDLIEIGSLIQKLDTKEAVQDALKAVSADFQPTMVQAGMLALEMPIVQVSYRLDELRHNKGLTTGWWMKGVGGKGGLNSNKGSTSAEYTLGGVLIGYDTRINQNLIAGAYAGWNTIEVETSRNDEGDIQTYLLGGYLGYYSDGLHLNAQAAYGRQSFKTNRSIFGSGDLITADYRGNVFGARVEAGYDVAQIGEFTITPYVAGTYIHSQTDAFSESGLAGVTAGKSGMGAFTAETGVKLGGKKQLGNGSSLGLYGKVGVSHDFGKSRRDFSIAGSEFTSHGSRGSKTNVLVGVTAEYQFNDRLSMYGGADLKLPTDGGKVANSFNVGLSVKF